MSQSNPKKSISLNSWQEFMRESDAATTFHDYRSAFEGSEPFAITRELRKALDDSGPRPLTAVFAARKGRVDAFWLDDFHNHLAIVSTKLSGDPVDVVSILSLGPSAKDRISDMTTEIALAFDSLPPAIDNPPTWVLITGPVATGKSTIRHEKYRRGYVTIDAAEIFLRVCRGRRVDFPPPPSEKELAEQLELIGSGIATRAVRERRNIVTELIGVPSEPVKQLMDAILAAGYRCKNFFVQCEFEESQRRNLARGENDISAYYTDPYHVRWILNALQEYSREAQGGRQHMVSGSPDGSILDQLSALLASTNLTTSREQDTLVVRHEHFSTRVRTVPGDEGDSPLGRIQSVIQIRSDLPAELARMIIENRKLADAVNRMASLGALTFDKDQRFVGSRLTIFDSENAWNIQCPLVVLSIIGAADAMISAAGKELAGRTSDRDVSAWTAKDFEQVEQFFSGRCVCTTSELGFTAEFGLRPGQATAVAGHQATALWRMDGEQSHPAGGGGLFCLLQLPQRIRDERRLSEVLKQLNQLEMHPHPLPPHFGAWCAGELGGNPTYVSFLPNALYKMAPGIAVNMTVWAEARAQWANITLASMGISLEA